METSVNNKKIDLRTHFYNNTYSEAKKIIIEYLKNNYARLDGISDEYFEITAHDYVFDVTFIMHEDELLSVDFLVISPFLYNKKKYIKSLYKYLDSKLSLVKIGDLDE